MKLLIVDAPSFLWRAFHAVPAAYNEDGISIHALEYFARFVLKRIRTHAWATHVLVVFDGSGPNFRTELYPDYKAHRPPMDDSLREQINIAPMLCAAYGMASVVSDGCEADDVVATAARQAVEAGAEVMIASPDKDILQLVRSGVSVYDQKNRRKFSTDADVLAYLGVRPDQVADWLALAGDTADGFPGIPGVGPKIAASWLRLGGSIDGLLACPGMIGSTRLQKVLLRNVDNLQIFRRLARLRDDVPNVPDVDSLLLDVDAAPIRMLRRLGISSLANIVPMGQ